MIKVIVLLLLIGGCRPNGQKEDILTDYHVKMDIDTSKKNIGQPSNERNQLGIYLGLNPLNLGYDSIQIRIWFYYPGQAVGDVIVLKENKKGWHGKYLKFNYLYSHSGRDSIELTHDKDVSPSNWTAFMGKLFNSNIKYLPDSRKLQGYEVFVMDAAGIEIEYADKYIYRLYGYASPKFSTDDFTEVRHI